MIRAGQLRHSVAIQSATESRDSYDVDFTWTTVATVRASVSPVSGTESIVADQEQATGTHNVVMRYYNGLTTSHRLLWGSRVLEIQSIVDVDERNRRVELLCKEDV